MGREHVWGEESSQSLELGRALLDGHSRCLGRQIMELGGGTTRLGVEAVVSTEVQHIGRQEEKEGSLGGWSWRLYGTAGLGWLSPIVHVLPQCTSVDIHERLAGVSDARRMRGKRAE